jgi:hypothetical protein
MPDDEMILLDLTQSTPIHAAGCPFLAPVNECAAKPMPAARAFPNPTLEILWKCCEYRPWPPLYSGSIIKSRTIDRFLQDRLSLDPHQVSALPNSW